MQVRWALYRSRKQKTRREPASPPRPVPRARAVAFPQHTPLSCVIIVLRTVPVRVDILMLRGVAPCSLADPTRGVPTNLGP